MKQVALCALPLALAACGGSQHAVMETVIAPTSELRAQTAEVIASAGFDPYKLDCSSRVDYGDSLYSNAKDVVAKIAQAWDVTPDAAQTKTAARTVLGYLVRVNYQALGAQNLGVLAVKDHMVEADGVTHPLLIFRSGPFADAAEDGGCFDDLLNEAHVRHVINLYTDNFPFFDWIDAERARAESKGVSFFDDREHITDSEKPWRSLISEEETYTPENVAYAQQEVARLIKTAILRPNGEAPKGNIIIHCGGGMHRTGMIMGVIQRCINGDSWESIDAEYRYHTNYISEDRPGGFEEINLRFVKDFDCSLLQGI